MPDVLTAPTRPSIARARRFGVVLTLVAAFGGADGAGATTAVAPRAWAQDFCEGVGDWIDALDRAVAAVTVDAASPPTDVKAALTKLLRTVQAQTTKLGKRVEATGRPAIEGGATVAAVVLDHLEDVGDAIADARIALAATSTEDSAVFAIGTAAAYASVTAALDEVSATFDEGSDALASPKLQKALRATRACDALVNG